MVCEEELEPLLLLLDAVAMANTSIEYSRTGMQPVFDLIKTVCHKPHTRSQEDRGEK
jgi:hypothetical protein